MKSLLTVMLMVIGLNQAFASSTETEIWADKSMRRSLAEHGIEVDQKELIEPGFGIRSITSLPVTILTIGHFRKSNVRIKVKVGEDKGTVRCVAIQNTIDWELVIYNCRLTGIAEIPSSVYMEKGILIWPQQEGRNALLQIHK